MADVNETTHSTTGKDLDTKFLDGSGLGHVFEILKNEHKILSDEAKKYTDEELKKALTPPLGMSFEEMTWKQISILSEIYGAEELSSYIGETKRVYVAGSGFLNAMLVGLEHDDLADGSGKATFTFMFVDEVLRPSSEPPDESFPISYGTSWLRQFLLDNVEALMPDDLLSVVKPVNKKCASAWTQGTDGRQNPTDYENVSDMFWLPSMQEIRNGNYVGYYDATEEGTTYEYFKSVPSDVTWTGPNVSRSTSNDNDTSSRDFGYYTYRFTSGKFGWGTNIYGQGTQIANLSIKPFFCV